MVLRHLHKVGKKAVNTCTHVDRASGLVGHCWSLEVVDWVG